MNVKQAKARGRKHSGAKAAKVAAKIRKQAHGSPKSAPKREHVAKATRALARRARPPAITTSD